MVTKPNFARYDDFSDPKNGVTQLSEMVTHGGDRVDPAEMRGEWRWLYYKQERGSHWP
jgi:hypothetical protein